jgi:predicted DNA-binding transcriptional regulator AlpA
MNSKITGTGPSSAPTTIPVLLTPKAAAAKCQCSISFLAKKRMTGDGPPYIKVGTRVRYTEPAVMQWMKSRTRTSTSAVL